MEENIHRPVIDAVLKHKHKADSRHHERSDEKCDKCNDRKGHRRSDRKREERSDSRCYEISDRKHDRCSDRKSDRRSDGKREERNDRKGDESSYVKREERSEGKRDRRSDGKREERSDRKRKYSEDSTSKTDCKSDISVKPYLHQGQSSGKHAHTAHKSDASNERRHKRRSPDVSSCIGSTAQTSGGDLQPQQNSSQQKIDPARERQRLAEYLNSGECLLTRGTPEYEDFWKFHAMYTRKLAASGVATSVESPPAAVGSEARSVFPLPAFSTEQLCPVRVERRIRDRRDAREQDLRDRERREPESIRARQTLAAYLHFLQRQKFTKLKKLRDAQRSLPIYQYKDEILSAIRDNSVVIVAGDTGCGKSTQLPQYLLQAGYKSIACTQPRRIACVSLCQRVSFETLQEYGGQIGYQVRFDRRRTGHTRVLFLTEGLLLRQISVDPLLTESQGYDVVVLDEVHERHLQGDFLLGVMKCLARQRADLRLVLMSATINLQLFSDYFRGQAPVIQIPGRLFPIQVQYRPVPAIEAVTGGGKLNPAPYVRILQLIDSQVASDERGDVLIFVSGAAEIATVAEACAEYGQQVHTWLVLPLHSGLAVAEQEKVFALPPDGVRKCIVSTNIAETSVTIDGVRFVIDSGKVKELSYDGVTRMRRLKEFWVSQASAEQRKGRAGRTGPGVCYRLFSEDEYDMLAPYATPEIQRVPLESLLLQMFALGLPDPRRFPFVDRPPEDTLEDALGSLVKQGALTSAEELTPLGSMLPELPVDVPIGKMLVLGSVLHQMGPTLSVAAALSVQSPLTNRAFRDPKCLTELRQLHSSHGDTLSLLSVLVAWLEVKVEGKLRSRNWCWERGVEEQRLFELTKLRRQFLSIMESARLLPKPPRLQTAADRVRRHGELAQLRAARRQLQLQQPTRQRLSATQVQLPDQPPAAADDAADIDFKLRVDRVELQELLKASKMTSYQDQTLLKVILCSGLYPNFALPDLHNTYKVGADLLFHSPSKPFVVLHPNSVLSLSPEVLQVADSDVSVTSRPRPQRHSVCSNKHQLLAFVSLLETNKPYVIGVTRVPALQASLLFSNRIDTDATFSSLCCDQWAEYQCRDVEAAQQLVARTVALRAWWSQLLQTKLNGLSSEEVEESEDESALRARLVAGLIEFLHTDVHYSYRRLLPADHSDIYVDSGAASAAADENEGAAAADRKLPGYLHYESLVTEVPILPEEGRCPYCETTLSFLPLERVLHWRDCIYQQRAKLAASSADGSSGTDSTAGVPSSGGVRREEGHWCDHCRTRLVGLTPLQLLRHRRSHDAAGAAAGEEEPAATAGLSHDAAAAAAGEEEPASTAGLSHDAAGAAAGEEEPASTAGLSHDAAGAAAGEEEPASTAGLSHDAAAAAAGEEQPASTAGLS